MNNTAKFTLILLILTAAFILQSGPLQSQDKKPKDTTAAKLESISGDTSEINAIENLEKIFVSEIIRQNNEKRITRLREEQLSRVYAKIDEIRSYFSKGVDSAKYNSIIRLAESGYEITSDILNTEDVNLMTPRNLTTSLLLNKEMLNDLKIIDKEVNLRISEVTALRKSLDSLANDTIIFKIPKDTALIGEYFKIIGKLADSYNPADTMLINSLNELNLIEGSLSDISAKLNESIWRIENIRAKDELSFFSGSLLKKNYPFIWDNSAQNKTFGEAFAYSTQKNLRVFMFYVVNNILVILIILLLTIAVYVILRKFRIRIKASDNLHTKFGDSVFVTGTFTAAIYLSLCVLQFLLPRPPLVFSGLLWLFTGLLLLLILRKRKEKKLFVTWLWILILSVITFNSNLMLVVTVFERWVLLLLSAVSVYSLLRIKKNTSDFTADKKWLKNIVNFCIAVFALSVVTNIIGYFNLTKLIFITSVLTIYLSLLFYAAFMYLNDGILILTEFSEVNSGDSFTKSMENLKRSFPKAAKLLLITGVVILISRNFYLYDYFAEGLSIFLETKRTLGDFTFQIGNILLFIIITGVSALLSKIISLYSELKSSGLFSGKDERGGIGNWLLLIRIAVFSTGLLIAFVSSGFPMDKLTIIIGSLGVGIGLGLQSIVGNLFSGVLLAFEKPVKIGDQIEVDGKTGIIKEIGIRSSKLETFEGSDVIIPNGDLLTKHVINWTRKNNKRRADITLKAENVNDVRKCKELILSLLDEDPQAEKNPPPMVLVNKFEGSGIEFRVLFWTDINNYLQIKSEVYYKIREAIKTEGININN